VLGSQFVMILSSFKRITNYCCLIVLLSRGTECSFGYWFLQWTIIVNGCSELFSGNRLHSLYQAEFQDDGSFVRRNTDTDSAAVLWYDWILSSKCIFFLSASC